MHFRKSIAILAIVLTAAVAQAQNSGNAVLKTYHINSGGGWDYISVSPLSETIYVSHGTQVNILDKTSGDSVGVIKGTTGVHGIVFAPAEKKGFISNGRLNNVFVFDALSNQITDSVAAGENPDAMCYDAKTNRVIVGNGRSKNASIIDAATNKVLATIPLTGKPEAIVSDEAGTIFINVEDKNEVAVVDIKTFKIKQYYSLNGGDEPGGLAIDRKAGVLFVACGGNDQLIVLDAKTGEQKAILPIGKRNDALAFDAKSGTVYASNGDGTLSVIRSVNGTYKVVSTIITKTGARTIAIDPITQLLYLPTADFEPQALGAKERPKMIPGTFEILVVGPTNK